MRYILITSFLALSACTEPGPDPAPTMSVADAMSVCRADIIEATTPKSSVAVGVGVSGGDITPRANISVGIDVTSDAQKQKRYEACVMRNSGESPTEPFQS